MLYHMVRTLVFHKIIEFDPFHNPRLIRNQCLIHHKYLSNHLRKRGIHPLRMVHTFLHQSRTGRIVKAVKVTIIIDGIVGVGWAPPYGPWVLFLPGVLTIPLAEGAL